jgi:MFS transporter, MHS family, proline/betaine transporter
MSCPSQPVRRSAAVLGLAPSLPVRLTDAPVSLFIRSGLSETLVREAASAETADIVLDIAKRHRTNLLLAMGVMIGPTVTNYIVGHYMTTYAIHTLHLPASTATQD